MSKHERIRRQQILREAEGYIDLVTVLGGQLALEPTARDRIAARALACLEGIEQSPGRRAHVYYLKGQALRTMERYREAITAFEAAAELDGDNIHVWLALGWCHKRNKRLDLAIQSLEEALSVEPNMALLHYNLACYWALAKNVKLAVAYLANAFDIDGDYRDLVADEHDFDAIRNHPEFLALTTVIV